MTKLVFISDTHNKHKKIDVPPGDILVHSGDFSGYGYLDEVESFINWFCRQPHPHKVFIAGNHDRSLDPQFALEYVKWADRETHVPGTLPPRIQEMLDKLPDNVHYLNDSGVTIRGIKFWGSPIQPAFGYSWAFNKQRGPDIAKHWDLIPADTDVLITHGPPAYKHDFTLIDRLYVGCEQLAYSVKEIKPKIHAFGHIHEGYGLSEDIDTIYVNASSCTLQYQPDNEPISVYMCDESNDTWDVGVWIDKNQKEEHLCRDAAEQKYALMRDRGAIPAGDFEFADFWKQISYKD